MQALFWISLALLFYTYLGYGLLLFVVALFYKRKKPAPSPELPALTLIVPAYNEESFIEKKIENTLSLHYPEGKLFLLFVTDGSTDRTNALIGRYKEVGLLTGEKRLGKSAAINRAMQQVKTPVVVFTDANTLLQEDCLLQMVQHYSDSRVGGVAGEKRIMDKDLSTVGRGERLYWQYESLLKKAGAKFYSVVGAAGELFSIRTALFRPVNENVILDDFVISANVCLQGYRFVYEEKAFALETASASLAEERKRKTRISAGCFQALLLLKGLLNPFRNARLTFQYISHRVLRWTLCPLCLPLLLLSNSALVFSGAGPFYSFFLAGQVLFYCLAFWGGLLAGKENTKRLVLVPYYFVFMNWALCTGFYRFLARKQTVFWKMARRNAFL